MTLPMSRHLSPRARRAAALTAFAVSIASFATLVVQVATALPAAAADVDLGMEAAIGLPCVQIDSWDSGPVTVTQKRAGKTIASGTLDQSTQSPSACVKPLKSGDVLVIARGSTSRTVTVPRGSLSVDLATDGISGTVPAGVSQVSLTIQDFTASFSTGHVLTPTVPVSGGTFATSTAGTMDLGRGDRVIVKWSDANDVWRIVRESTTAIVSPDAINAVGTGNPGAKVAVTLKTPKGVVRGVAATRVMNQPVASAGFFDAMFRKNGRSVVVKGGNVVVAKGLTGSFKVPRGLPVVDKATNSVEATCPANSDWLVLRDLTKVAGGRSANGIIQVSPVNPGGSLNPGTRVMVACQAPSGYGVNREVVVD